MCVSVANSILLPSPARHLTAVNSQFHLFFFVAITLFGTCSLPVPLFAADDTPQQTDDKYDQPIPGFERSPIKTYRLKVTVRLESPGARLTNVVATAPVPVDWREQKVQLLEKKTSRGVRVKRQRIGNNGEMILIQVPTIPAGGVATVERIYEVTRYRVKFTGDPKTLRIPPKVSRQLREFLKAAPGVESNKGKIKKLRESLDSPTASAWNRVQAYAVWIRKNVRYQQANFRGAMYALERKVGDCEDMTALFVALCHTAGIPARTVWIEGHAYPEFYLEEETGKGYWIPVELVGPNWFGEMAAYQPIMQKGDRVYDPILRKPTRYIPQRTRAFGGRVKLTSTRTILPAEKTDK